MMIKKVMIAVMCLFTAISIVYSETTSLEYNFVRDYIESLRHFKINIERGERLNSTKFNNEVDFWIEGLKVANLSVDEIEMAKGLIVPYENSENLLIRDTASAVLINYAIQKAIAQKRLDMMEHLLKDPEKFDEGQAIVEIGKQAATSDKAWTMLLQGSALVTHCLVSQNSDGKGRLSYLVITSQERKELMNLLIEIFGRNIESGLGSKDLTQFEGVGATLYHVLSGEHKSSDERK